MQLADAIDPGVDSLFSKMGVKKREGRKEEKKGRRGKGERKRKKEKERKKKKERKRKKEMKENKISEEEINNCGSEKQWIDQSLSSNLVILLCIFQALDRDSL